MPHLTPRLYRKPAIVLHVATPDTLGVSQTSRQLSVVTTDTPGVSQKTVLPDATPDTPGVPENTANTPLYHKLMSRNLVPHRTTRVYRKPADGLPVATADIPVISQTRTRLPTQSYVTVDELL